MPRNACRTCRSSKVRCLVKNHEKSCDRCLQRNFPCSYVQVSTQAGSPSATLNVAHLSQYRSAISPSPESPALYRLSHDTPVLDIGRGRPEDILREGELTQSLLLLYFNNFSDVHFMFDEELFLRQYTVGEIPKFVLYAVMALAIRFSHAPFRDELSPSHRGEALYEHTRKLLQQDFDRPSIANIQAYVLLSTYKLTFGGSMQAYIYLGYATNLLKVLRLLDSNAEVDPLHAESNRRLICTMAFMDRLLSFPLRLSPHFSSTDILPIPLGEDEFWALKRRASTVSSGTGVNLTREILTLSGILHAVCQTYRSGASQDTLADLEVRFINYSASLHPLLQYNDQNLERHLQDHSLRKFAYMHLLYHHIGQLIHFHALKGIHESGSSLLSTSAKCHKHASAIVTIINYTWTKAGFDLHNFSIGQILTIATVVHTHALITAPTVDVANEVQNQVRSIRNCIIRIQRHTRLFNWVLQHLEAFWKVVYENTASSSKIFDRNPNLLGEMLQLGSFYESVDQRTGGRHRGVESLLTNEQSDPIATSHAAGVQTSDAMSSDATHTNHLGQWPREMHMGSLDDFAWIFSDSSLSELYVMPPN